MGGMSIETIIYAAGLMLTLAAVGGLAWVGVDVAHRRLDEGLSK